MGLILPFALVFVAIPLETFVHSLRTVLGLIGIGLLRLLAVTLQALGALLEHAGAVLTRVYDVLIFMPLWIETKLNTRQSAEGRLKNQSEVSA